MQDKIMEFIKVCKNIKHITLKFSSYICVFMDANFICFVKRNKWPVYAIKHPVCQCSIMHCLMLSELKFNLF